MTYQIVSEKGEEGFVDIENKDEVFAQINITGGGIMFVRDKWKTKEEALGNLHSTRYNEGWIGVFHLNPQGMAEQIK